jgi:putative ABC transport system permease protein
VLLVCAGLLGRTFYLVKQNAFGFQPEGVLTMTFDLPGAVTRYGREVAERSLFHERLLTTLRTQPGVVSAGSAARLPFAARLDATDAQVPRRFTIVDKAVPPDERPFARIETVSGGYLETLGVPVLDGRSFDARDTLSSAPVALVSQELRRRHFGQEPVIGRQVLFGRNPLTIVGVVGDVKTTPVALSADPTIYVPMSQSPIFRTRLAVRTAGDPWALLPVVRQTVTAIDAELPVFDVKPLSRIAADAVATERFALMLFGLFATLALGLSAIGVYGVLAYAVAHRIPEFGVRLALGAHPRQITQMILLQGGWLVSLGIVLGVIVSSMATRAIRGLLFRVQPFDLVTISAVALMFCLIAFAACVVPARRAARVDPLTALRSE